MAQYHYPASVRQMAAHYLMLRHGSLKITELDVRSVTSSLSEPNSTLEHDIRRRIHGGCDRVNAAFHVLQARKGSL